MKAKEMFEKLGFIQAYNGVNGIRYEKDNKGSAQQILFHEKLHEYSTAHYGDYILEFFVDVKLHQAITQQMKELGWLQ